MAYSIKNWNEKERPREKLIKHGAEALTDAELIAIIIRSGDRKRDAVMMARELLNENDGSLTQLINEPAEKLMRNSGIGITKAASIKAALELGKRAGMDVDEKHERIMSSDTVAGIFSPMLRHLKHEEFWAIFMDRSNRIIKKEKISSGGTFSTVVDIKIVAKKAVDLLSNSVIVVHNHPSGNMNPGDLDKNITKRLLSALEMFEIRLLDHIIIAGKGYFSFADSGIL